MQQISYLRNGGGKYDVLKITLAILIVVLHTRPLPDTNRWILFLLCLTSASYL